VDQKPDGWGPAAAGTKPGLGERFDDWLYHNRSWVLVAATLGFVLNVLYWFLSNLFPTSPQFNGRVEATDTAASLALALATISLSVAAYVTARVGDKQERAARALARAAQYQANIALEQLKSQAHPSLAIQFRAESARAGQSSETRTLSPGDLMALGGEDLAVYLFNRGPGIACEIEVLIEGLGAVPGFDGKTLPKAERCSRMLGPGESTQITFPGPLLGELWPGISVGQKFTILITATASDTLEADLSEFTFLARGGLIAEQVHDLDGKPALAWRILTDGEFDRLSRRQAKPNDLSDVVGNAGFRRVKRPPISMA